MSGDNQHFLPRFLQRGFSSKGSQKRIFTWLFNKTEIPAERNTKEIGVRKNFYSEAPDSGLDDEITARENTYAPLVRMLREDIDPNINCAKIPELIAHLEIRSDHLRQQFGSSAKFSLDDLMAQLDTKFSQMKGSPFYSKWLFLRESIEKLISAHREDWVKTAHQNALKKSIAPDQRIKNYAQLKFKVLKYEPSNMILGDSAVLFYTDGTRQFKPFWDKDDRLLDVFLPLAPDKILVGHNQGELLIPSLTEIREEIAKASSEFFISAYNTISERELQSKIGTNSKLISEEDLTQGTKETIEEFFKNCAGVSSQ